MEIPELTHTETTISATERIQAGTSQFVTASNQELQRLMDKNTNKNTLKSTSTWVRRFEEWRKAKGIEHEVLSGKSFSEMNDILGHFYAELRKEDGTDYTNLIAFG